MHATKIPALLLIAFLLVPGVRAQDDAAADTRDPVKVYREHVITLASPFMEGRIPGSIGAERARDYVEMYLRAAGLEPAFGGTTDETGIARGADSFRQKVDLPVTRKVAGVHAATKDGVALNPDAEIVTLPYGVAGEVEGPLVFAGYGIEQGPDGSTWKGYEDGDAFEGAIAVIFRFEPMDEAGVSRWAAAPTPWTRAAGLTDKIEAVAKRGAAAVVVVTPPGVADRRTDLGSYPDAAPRAVEVPVFGATAEGLERILKASGAPSSDLMALRKQADAGRAVTPLGVTMSMNARIEASSVPAFNVGGLLRGKGALADQLVIVGAHIDHLGMGAYSSRARADERGQLHPGADDNASGTAAVLMLAERMKKRYDALPADASARSILFVGLDAEELGLWGARHYVKYPIAPLEDTALMINFDMIGRITEKRLRVDGATSGVGLDALVRPIFEASPLTIVEDPKGRIMMASDHAAFVRKTPVLFGIISPFHDDYHTPRDTSDAINFEDGVLVIDLFEAIAEKVAMHPERIGVADNRL